MKSLVLAEKPSVAREIARVLQCHDKKKGFIEGPHYVVTWALGHLITLAEPHDYDQKYKTWRMEDLPLMPENMRLKVIKQSSQQYQVVKNLMQRSDIKEMVVATDAGREGELVARWIMEKARWKKPFKRLWISSQTDGAIREGFARLRPGREYDKLFDAAVCRAEADWLIGLNVTRTLTCRYNAQLTAGRVQTPTLAMIVQREEEIKNFVPVDYWTIRTNFGDYFGDWRDKNGQSRLFEYKKAEEIINKIQGHSGVIKDIRMDSKSEPAPLAYDLTELQRDANRRYAWSAKQTLSVLQRLYEEHKVLTYPRTDSRYITTDIVETLPLRLKSMGIGPYAELVRPLLKHKLVPGKRFVDNSKVSDHHAIIPTEQPLKISNLSIEEKKLYDLVAKRFIAVLYPPFRYEQTTITTEINGENFYSRGKIIKDRGWKAVTAAIPGEGENVNKEVIPEQNLNEFRKGEKKQIQACKINRGKTKPPARYTEASLLTAMENPGKFVDDEELRETLKGSGLGTPATRAEIIEKLLNTFYIERNKRELIPTSKGKQLIELAPENLRSPEMTARWEKNLTDIAKGRGNKQEFLQGIRKNAVEMVNAVRSATMDYHHDNVSKIKCPVCGKFMLVVNAKKGKMLVCSDPACGHRQPEKQDDNDIFKKGKNSGRLNQKLIRQYSDKEEINQSLGDLLKAALEEKNKKSKNKS